MLLNSGGGRVLQLVNLPTLHINVMFLGIHVRFKIISANKLLY